MQIQLTLDQGDINKLGKTITKTFDLFAKDPRVIEYLYAFLTKPAPKSPKPTKAKKKPKAKAK